MVAILCALASIFEFRVRSHASLELELIALRHSGDRPAAIAKSEVLSEQRRQEVEAATKRIAALEVHIATLRKTVVKAEVLGDQQRQEVQSAAKRADHLTAELIEMTGEFVAMSTEQYAAMDKLRVSSMIVGQGRSGTR
jgi:hypothetical protein